MQALFDRLRAHARRHPDAIALSDERAALCYRDLDALVAHCADGMDGERIGLLLDNCAAWATCDLAVHRRGAVCVPLPTFFTDAQLAHVIEDAGIDLIVTDCGRRAAALAPSSSIGRLNVAGRSLALLRVSREAPPALPAGTAKITYTSGTTGAPKGVCLSADSLARVTASLCSAVGASEADRALSLLPLSTLLENIAGVYSPIWAGGRAELPAIGGDRLAGQGLDPAALARLIARARPTTLVLVPALLKLLVETAAAGVPVPPGLRFVAVGGAPVSERLLERARALGLPVYQGYGLSEAASVVSLNLPGAARAASVGRALAHAGVRIASDGEVMVRGELHLGYVGGAANDSGEFATGDLGRMDADGFLHLCGRKKTAFCTAYGRNVSPEWVESELTGHAAVAQAAVYGEGQTFNVAVLVANRGSAAVVAAVSAVNRGLPPYARVRRWVIAQTPFTIANGLVRAAGTLDRRAVAERYRKQIETLYEDTHADHVL